MKFSIEGDNNGSIGALGNNLTELKETLLSNIERMEAILLEAKSTASREAQQYEELRQMEEAKVGMLEVQLQEKEESLTAKTQEMEQLVTEKETLSSLQEKHNSEIVLLRSETEAKVGMLEAQLQEKEESLRSKESAIRQMEESLTAKIQEMQHRLTEKEDLTGLLEQRTAEITNLRSETQVRVGILEVQLQEKEESLRMKESANRQMEESITAKIHDLEHQLTEKEGLLDKGGQEIMNFRSEAEAIILRLQALLRGNGGAP